MANEAQRGESSAHGSSGEPHAWLGLSQQQLDDAYDQTKYAANAALVIKRYTINSRLAGLRLGAPRRFRYGSTPMETLAVFPAERRDAPVLVFVHGGAWRSTVGSDYWFLAESFVNAGVHYVVLDFANALDAGGDLTVMADQVRRAIAWVHRNAKEFGGRADRIYLCGHSSGAHLGGVMLTQRWRDRGLPADIIKGALLISGMYDLRPVRLSARSRYVAFNDEMEASLSPQRWIDRIACPVSLMYGSLESPEFQRQSADFAAALRAIDRPAACHVLEGYNHFEVLELLANPLSEVGRTALSMIAGGDRDPLLDRDRGPGQAGSVE